ncbi:MAG: heme-binding domain-containing protein [Vicinamibacterales bacterium]
MSTTRRVIPSVVASMAAGFVVAQFFGPTPTNPPTDAGAVLFVRTHVPADAAGVLRRACRDCHSNETTWPWYSHLAPVSWFVIDHVNHGRSHFNYSQWAKYSAEDVERLLKASCDLARKGAMPIPSYLRMHADAALSPADVEAVCRWSAHRPIDH